MFLQHSFNIMSVFFWSDRKGTTPNMFKPGQVKTFRDYLSNFEMDHVLNTVTRVKNQNETFGSFLLKVGSFQDKQALSLPPHYNPPVQTQSVWLLYSRNLHCLLQVWKESFFYRADHAFIKNVKIILRVFCLENGKYFAEISICTLVVCSAPRFNSTNTK